LERPIHTITCVAYSGIWINKTSGSFSVDTIVIPLHSIDALDWIRRFNLLEAPKIFQNGKYDNFYFLRFASPVKNWLFDTMEAHHCSYAELPKNLGYISSFYLREVSFWKDEGKGGDLQDFYRYNAKDAWATANTFLAWLGEAKDWALKNYLLKFGLVFPCLACEVDGLKINQSALSALREEQDKIQTDSLSHLRKQIGVPLFNPRSPKQVLDLLHMFGCRELDSSDAKSLEKAADKHPLFKRIIDEITSYRESSKLISTYLDAKLWGGKLLYTLNPSGTDTGRLASRESQLWCGTQLQNLPSYFKRAIYAEEGYYLGEGDFEQAESRTTAYITGDENLIRAVESKSDFHSTNASAFFGIPYEKIYDDSSKSTLDKPLRDLAKRVNHGANYNMMEDMLLATMGMKRVLEAKKLLGLPAWMTPKQVCGLLLKNFDKTYPVVRGDYQTWVKTTVKLTKLLTSALGWSRFCFGEPWKSKPDLNAYVAHVPQNLSVGIINEAFKDIYWKIQVPSNGAFRLKGQIHDSILFAYKIGRDDLVADVLSLLQRPVKVKDIKGVERTLLIPAAMKGNASCWANLEKWPFKKSEDQRKELDQKNAPSHLSKVCS
jgi:hypothetical protein